MSKRSNGLKIFSMYLEIISHTISTKFLFLCLILKVDLIAKIKILTRVFERRLEKSVRSGAIVTHLII